MARTVRCGLIQASTPQGPEAGLAAIKKAMIAKHVRLIEDAARKKVKILCLQELFYGPYFCAEQETRWYELTERVPDGPTVTLMRKLARQAQDGARSCRSTRRSSRASTTTPRPSSTPTAPTSASTGRPTSRTASPASGRSSTSARATSATRCSRRAYAKVGVYICYDRHFPEGARAPRPGRRARSCSTRRRPSPACPSTCGNSSSRPTPWRTATSSAPSTASASKRPWNIGEFYGQSYFCDPRGQIVAEAPARRGRARRGRSRPRPHRRGPRRLAVLPRPQARCVWLARAAVTLLKAAGKESAYGHRPLRHVHGLHFPNPFLLSSAPPTESESNIMRAFEAGLGRRGHEDDRHAPGDERRRAPRRSSPGTTR